MRILVLKIKLIKLKSHLRKNIKLHASKYYINKLQLEISNIEDSINKLTYEIRLNRFKRNLARQKIEHIDIHVNKSANNVILKIYYDDGFCILQNRLV